MHCSALIKTLKMIFSIFRFFLHPQIPDFQILSNHNKPHINEKLIYAATLMTGFVFQGLKGLKRILRGGGAPLAAAGSFVSVG